MSSLPLSTGILPDDAEVYDLDEVADRLGVSPGRVRTLIRDHNLLAASRDGVPVVPALFFGDGDDDGHRGLAKHFEGLVTILLDGGYTRDDALEWFFTVQDDLGMHPAQALHTHSAREVIRRAQAQAF
ncbi:MAG: Rv2175c family DNA-binding protein [Gordonia sp. (in: high G+C Gram-positive bacteria)]|uniref:Rv2175c family DNA-binding protein n=1 Tax=Gordonia sp. (in: high G+C Gram-positive bacteria) TaxID=84139 RepID=UPI0039E5768F